MKLPKPSFFNKCLLILMSLTLSSQATTAYGKTFFANNVPSLKNAIKQAKNNGGGKDLIRFAGNATYNDGGTIIVNTPVTIDGINRGKTRIKNGDNKGIVFDITSSNVTLQNIGILANNGNGTRGVRLVGPVANVVIKNCALIKNQIGISAFGSVPVNLTVNGNNFNGNNTALWTFRDTGKAGGNPLWGGKYVIAGNYVSGPAGFIIDNGNDGNEWNAKTKTATFKAPGFKGSSKSPSVTNYANGSAMINNTLVNMTSIALGLAKCNNFDIVGNKVTMKSGGGYGGCIQMEHRTKSCVVKNNTLNTAAGKSGIYLIAFSDHGAKHVYKNGTRNIVVENNVFTGGGTAFTGFAFGGLVARKNNFSKNKRFTVFNVLGGRNSFSQNFGNIGAPGGKIPAGK